jgi:DNA invertase Pin-like site-specific DNA recombinase
MRNQQNTFAYYCRVATEAQNNGIDLCPMTAHTQEQAYMQLAEEQGLTVTSIVTSQPITVDIYCHSAASDGNTLAEQEAIGKLFAKDTGLTVAMIHSEIGSGLTLERPGLSLMRQRYKNGIIQGVVILDSARLTRDSALLAMLREEIKTHNVTLYTVTDIVQGVFQAYFNKPQQ